MGYEDLNIESIAHDLIDEGKVVEGYTLVLLQQIRDSLRDMDSSIGELISGVEESVRKIKNREV